MSRSASEVSVVTVNWNGKNHLQHLLPSLTCLDCREIIVVDNASSDGSQEFVRRNYPQVEVLENQMNRGFAHPCNLGAQHAGGRYVAFINNDMRADGRWLEAALARLTESAPCIASRIMDWEGHRVDFSGSSLQYLGYALQRDSGELLKGISRDTKLLFPCGGAMLIDRRVFLKLGGFDEDFFAIYEDVDLGWRLWICGYEVDFAPESVVYHRGHGTFQTHENEKMRYLMHRNALLTILKNYDDNTVRKILPLAVVLAIKRAVLFSGVEKERFYLWAKTKDRLKAGDAQAHAQLMDSLNHLVSLDDVLESLPHVLAKRRKIQSLRQRSDAEIIKLFVDPLRPILENSTYLLQESRYLDLLDLGALFETSSRQPRVSSLAPAVEERLEALQSQLSAWKWLGIQALLHPPSSSGNKISLFLNSWRKEGLMTAWRRFMEYVNRGI